MKPLPCPFCGHLPEVGPENPDIDGTTYGYVECVNKRCPAQPHVEDGSMISDERGSAAYKRLAVKRWNRRKAPLGEEKQP